MDKSSILELRKFKSMFKLNTTRGKARTILSQKPAHVHVYINMYVSKYFVSFDCTLYSQGQPFVLLKRSLVKMFTKLLNWLKSCATLKTPTVKLA